MDTQKDRTTTEVINRIPLPADDLPIQTTEEVVKTDPAGKIKEMEYFPAVVEWEGREVRRTESAELTPYVEMRSQDEITQVVKYVATKGAEVVAVGVYFVAIGVLAIVKYVAIGAGVFVLELVKQLFKMSRKGPLPAEGNDKNVATRSGINITTNVVAGGNVNINQNIHIG